MKYVTNIIIDKYFFYDYVLDEEIGLCYADKNSNEDMFQEYQLQNLCDDKNIYVLTSEVGSAASLAGMIKSNGIGTIIGREGSGGYSEKCGIKYTRIKLQNSGL